MVKTIVKLKEAQAKEPRDQAVIDEAMSNFSTAKKQFLDFANIIKLTTLATKIHDRLQPDRGEGFLREYGSVIIAKRRYLTTSDSDLVIDLYSFAEENQALATWMSVERLIALGKPFVDDIPKPLDALTDWMLSQRNGFARNGLHSPIPVGAVIDRGPDTTVDKLTTVDKPEFAFFTGSGLTWSPFDTVPPSYKDEVTKAVDFANSTKLRGEPGWYVPSGAQLLALFAELTKRNHDSTETYLRDLFLDKDITVGEFLWDSDTVQQRYCQTYEGVYICEFGITAHKGVSTTTLANDPHPQFSHVDFSTLPERYGAAKGGLLLVRDTGQAQYLP